jgi:hypothetical protein
MSMSIAISTARPCIQSFVVEQRMPSKPLASLKKWNVTANRRHDRVRIFPEEFAKLVAAAESSTKTIEGMTGPERA